MDKFPENIIEIDLIRIERNRDKLCQCNSLNIDIDTKNRKICCRHCKTERDPYDVLNQFANEWEKINTQIVAALEQKKQFDNYKPHLKIIKELERTARAGKGQMHPICPACDEPFMLSELTRFYGARFANGRIVERIAAKKKVEQSD